MNVLQQMRLSFSKIFKKIWYVNLKRLNDIYYYQKFQIKFFWFLAKIVDIFDIQNEKFPVN